MSTPVLHLVAGPNGAGKSTFAGALLIPRTRLPFVNADRISADECERLIAARASFITETVFSHASKLQLIDRARAADYTVLLHVVMVPENLAVARVADRVAAGGHTVPDERIRAHHARLWPLVEQARRTVDRAEFYDNASLDRPFRLVAVYEYGHVVGRPQWPAWAPAQLR